MEYRIHIQPLSKEDGGGYLATVPDLPGCMSDGETPEEAAHNVQDAMKAWLDENARLGRPAPVPTREKIAAVI